MATPTALTSPSLPPAQDHQLPSIHVFSKDVGDVATCILHTILFTRAPGPLRPSEATCASFPSISYSQCAVGDVGRKVEHCVRNLERIVNENGSTNVYVEVVFFERQVKKALFGLMSNEEKKRFEKWVVPISVVDTRQSQDEKGVMDEAETTLRATLLQILASVQAIDHVPSTMYHFEIAAFSEVEMAYGGSSVRMHPEDSY